MTPHVALLGKTTFPFANSRRHRANVGWSAGANAQHTFGTCWQGWRTLRRQMRTASLPTHKINTKKHGGPKEPPRQNWLIKRRLDDVDFCWEIRSNFKANFLLTYSWFCPNFHNDLLFKS